MTLFIFIYLGVDETLDTSLGLHSSLYLEVDDRTIIIIIFRNR